MLLGFRFGLRVVGVDQGYPCAKVQCFSCEEVALEGQYNNLSSHLADGCGFACLTNNFIDNCILGSVGLGWRSGGESWYQCWRQGR